MSLKHKQTAGTFHLEKISGNFGWELNGKRFFDSSHRKIPGKGRTSKKVSPFFRLERSERIFVFHYHVSRISCQFQVHRMKFATVILAKSGLYLSGSVYNLSFQCCLSLGIGKYLVFEKYIQMLIFTLAARNNRYILLTRFSRLFIL